MPPSRTIHSACTSALSRSGGERSPSWWQFDLIVLTASLAASCTFSSVACWASDNCNSCSILLAGHLSPALAASLHWSDETSLLPSLLAAPVVATRVDS